MKKFVALVFVILLIFSIFCLPSFAATYYDYTTWNLQYSHYYYQSFWLGTMTVSYTPVQGGHALAYSMYNDNAEWEQVRASDWFFDANGNNFYKSSGWVDGIGATCPGNSINGYSTQITTKEEVRNSSNVITTFFEVITQS